MCVWFVATNSWYLVYSICNFCWPLSLYVAELLYRHFHNISMYLFIYDCVRCVCMWVRVFVCTFLPNAFIVFCFFMFQKKNCIYCIVNVLLQTFIYSFCFCFFVNFFLLWWFFWGYLSCLFFFRGVWVFKMQTYFCCWLHFLLVIVVLYCKYFHSLDISFRFWVYNYILPLEYSTRSHNILDMKEDLSAVLGGSRGRARLIFYKEKFPKGLKCNKSLKICDNKMPVEM